MYNDFTIMGLSANPRLYIRPHRAVMGQMTASFWLPISITAYLGLRALHVAHGAVQVVEQQAGGADLRTRCAIPGDSSGNAGAADLATQAQIYHDKVALCLKSSRCTAIQTWGIIDKHSWIPGTYLGRGAALEFDTNYQPKAAYTSMMLVLQRVLVNSAP
jgi:Glycosyl hydrolase family 10